MYKKAKIVGIVLLAVTLLAGTAIAQRYGRVGSDRCGMGCDDYTMQVRGMYGCYCAGPMSGCIMRVLWDIDLTDSQEEEIETILDDAEDQIEFILENMPEDAECDEFIELFTSSNLTVSDLEEEFSSNDDFIEDMQSVMFETIVDVHNVLTEEQLEEVAENAEEYYDCNDVCSGFYGGAGRGSYNRRGCRGGRYRN